MNTQNLRLVEPQIKKLGRIAAILILILIISGSLFTIITPFFGWRTEVVISGSMEPAISTGSVVIVRPVIPDTLRKGDVIMYYSPDKTSLTTHRVFYVAYEPSLQFITKGDANNNSDVIPVTPGSNRRYSCIHYTVSGSSCPVHQNTIWIHTFPADPGSDSYRTRDA